LKVLAAEDNPTNQLVLATLLRAAGIEPTMVGDGGAAVEAYLRQEWDLILMDVQMPVMDGVSATREIRRHELESGMSPVPIIALTANAMAHQLGPYREAGMTGLVAKPLILRDLISAINEALVPSLDLLGRDEAQRGFASGRGRSVGVSRCPEECRPQG
jgi:CheY-like chemotaxis protein